MRTSKRSESEISDKLMQEDPGITADEIRDVR